MTSEAKYVLKELEKQAGSLTGVLQQQAKVEGLVQSQLDAVFFIDLFTELKHQEHKGGFDSIKENFNSVFYFEMDKNIMKGKHESEDN